MSGYRRVKTMMFEDAAYITDVICKKYTDAYILTNVSHKNKFRVAVNVMANQEAIYNMAKEIQDYLQKTVEVMFLKTTEKANLIIMEDE